MNIEVKIFEFLRVMKRILFDENYDFYKTHLDIPTGEIVNDLIFKSNYANQGYEYPLIINKGKRTVGYFAFLGIISYVTFL